MEKLKPKKYFSFQTKITLGIVSFALLFMGLISYLSFLNYKKLNDEMLATHLSIMVGMASLQVDGDNQKLLLTRADEGTDNFKEIQKKLQKVRSSAKDIQNIYFMRENENKEIIFVVSDSGIDPTLLPHFGDVYTSASPFLKNNFSNINSLVVEKGLYTDKWGTWLSGYTPIYDKDNKKVGVLGVDMSAMDVIIQNNKIMYLYLITFLLAGLLASLVGINISKRLSRSITSLNNMLKDEKSLEIFPASNDEIGELKNSFEVILDKNNESKIKIEEQLINENKTIDKINKILASKEVEIAELKKEINNLKKS